MSLPGRFLQIGQQRVFHHRGGSGRGRPLVLVHGYLVSHWQFRKIIPALAAEHDVVAFDFPGYGESDRPDPSEFRYDASGFLDTLIGVLDVLGIEKATLVGQSMGGAVSLYAAARRPERVERLVVVDPLCYPWRPPLPARFALAPVAGPWLLRAMATRGMCKQVMRREIYNDPACVSEDWIDYVWERLNRPGGIEAAAATMRFVADPGIIASSVRAVRAPTLIVWGENDRLFPSGFARRLEADITGSTSKIIPGCGHSPPEERPEELLATILPFLRAGQGSGAERRVA